MVSNGLCYLSCIAVNSLEKLGECGSDPYFPRARAPKYRMERGQAYLLSSEWVQEYPRRFGRHTRSQGPDSNRSRIAGCNWGLTPLHSAGNCVTTPPPWHE